jgi:hypothetical protein
MNKRFTAAITSLAFAALAVAAPTGAKTASAQTTSCGVDHGFKCGTVTYTICSVPGPGWCLQYITLTGVLYQSYL